MSSFHLTAALVSLCVSGHGFWLKNLKEAVFQVNKEMSPALAGFYVFWTMIIVLQVYSCILGLLTFVTSCNYQSIS